jgi:hypothetical protein
MSLKANACMLSSFDMPIDKRIWTAIPTVADKIGEPEVSYQVDAHLGRVQGRFGQKDVAELGNLCSSSSWAEWIPQFWWSIHDTYLNKCHDAKYSLFYDISSLSRQPNTHSLSQRLCKRWSELPPEFLWFLLPWIIMQQSLRYVLYFRVLWKRPLSYFQILSSLRVKLLSSNRLPAKKFYLDRDASQLRSRTQ